MKTPMTLDGGWRVHLAASSRPTVSFTEGNPTVHSHIRDERSNSSF